MIKFMNQKGPVNVILIILVIILASALGYVTLVKKPISQSPVLTETSALALVKSTWGDCTLDSCSEVVVSVAKQGSETYVVTATYEGLRDDSSSAQRKVAVATFNNGKWTLGTPTVTQQCWPGRGHQNFSSELCL